MPAQNEMIDILMQTVAGAMADLHTSTIAKVTSVGATTIECQPVINRVVNGESIPLPAFAEVPPIFLGGGSSYISHPIAVGDYCLLIFTERCFDRWWNGQDNQDPAEMRMHDYSDGFALCGLKNMAGAISIPTENTINGITRIGSENPTDVAVAASALLTVLNAGSDAAITAGVGAVGSGTAAFTAFKGAIAGLVSSAGAPKVKIK